MTIRLSWKRSSILAACIALACAACTPASPADDPDPENRPDPPPGGITELSGVIDADATWSGTINMTADTTIPAGISVTVAPGAWFAAAEATFLRVEGSLTIAGTTDEPVTIYPLADAPSWGGFTAEVGGSVDIAHVEGEHVSALLTCKQGAVFCRLQNVHFVHLGNALVTSVTSVIDQSYFEDMANAGISVRAGSDLTITDSYVLTSQHDLIVTQPGSRLTVDYSEIGGAQGSYEHCNFHIGGADYLSITNSNLVSSVYGIMLGGTTDAIIHNNNFMENDSDFLEVGANVRADMRFNYWDRGTPNLGPGYDTSSPAGAQIADAGPRI